MSDLDRPVQCSRHGESHAAYLCAHLARSSGLGFHAPAEGDDPRADAWCDACDAVQARDGGWNEENEDFADITLVCAACYDDLRRRHEDAPPAVRAAHPWRCATCGVEHDTLPLDFGFARPSIDEERLARAALTTDTCVVEGDHLVRGCVEIPLTDAPGRFVWGAWVSLGAESYARYSAVRDSDEGVRETPRFGWFCSAIPGYPETRGLKARVHFRTARLRPYIELEPSDHPLAVEQREGMTLARARELATLLGHGPG